MRAVDRYVLHDEIASGGMATVFLARLRGKVGFSRIVAVKALHPHYAKEEAFRAMFLDEARIVSRVRHPNVVPTIDVLEQDGDLYLIMDYVHGESLSRLIAASIKQKKPMPVGVACSILIDTLEGLHAAHEAVGENGEPLLIVHRDVSPQNILVGANGTAQVADFGIAKAAGRMSEKFSVESAAKGKAGYMAPEQARGKTDRRSDVYAAGVVLWEAIAGRKLFTGDSFLEIVTKAMDGDVPLLTSIRSDVPAALDDVVKRAMDHDMSRRFQTAREMVIALEKCGVRASAREVGDWVKEIAVESIERRSGIIARVEKTNDDDDDQVDEESASAPESANLHGVRRSRIETAIERPVPEIPSAPGTHFTGTISDAQRPATTKRFGLFAAIAAAVVGGIVGVIAFAHGHTNARPQPAAASISAPANPDSASAATTAAPLVTGDVTVSAAASSAPTIPTNAKPHTLHRTHVVAPARALGDAGTNCHWEQLPDEQGIMIPKKVCP